MTAQHGKNHVGDRNDHPPTLHGFDEFYGNLYHLNAEEEPEQPDYPGHLPGFKQSFAPRGVLACKASDEDDPTDDERFGRIGNQTIKDTGPLTRKRMETVENDLLARSLDFMDRAHEADKPFLAGRVPGRELNEDGFEGTAPVGSFPPNGYGQFAMIGNVWEWTTDWCEDPAKVSHACCSVECSQACIPRKVMKGSSHLCAPDYCRRYRPAARMPQPIATSISYLGIRCITPG